MTSNRHALVAYGTLRRAVGGPERLGLADRMTYVGDCRFEGRLYDLGEYPGAVPGSGTIHGELWHVSDPDVIDLIDRYEGYEPDDEEASLFVRRKVHLLTPSDCCAWVYWYNRELEHVPHIPSGDWARYLGETQ